MPLPVFRRHITGYYYSKQIGWLTHWYSTGYIKVMWSKVQELGHEIS